MKIIRIVFSIFCYFVVFISAPSASQIATTNDGKKVELHEDGTYSFVKKNVSNTYKKIEFSDFMIDSQDLVEKKIIIKGDVGFYNRSGKKYPIGQIYQAISTIGPSIPMHTSKLSRECLKKVHSKKCTLSCGMEISGVVKKDKYNQFFIEADSIKLVDNL
jgi:hypothetical protein